LAKYCFLHIQFKQPKNNMKKLSILVIAFLFIVAIGNAQDYTDRDSFKIGVHGAIPLGDASEISNFGLGLDISYNYGVSKVFDLGLATGFTNAFINTDDDAVENLTAFENVQFLPLAGVLRIYPHVRSRTNFGVDLGYALGIDEGNEGGFYYRPTLAINVNRGTEVTFTYTGVSLENGAWNTATLGLIFGF
jgi:hypothetical protein